MTSDLPCFIDLEASGLGQDSYPIAVAWSLPSGNIHRFLIRPDARWQHWDDEAEQIHGIDRDRLQRNGWETSYVRQRLHEDLADRTVYSDAARFDELWLERLFALIDEPIPFTIGEVEDLFIERLRQPGEMVYETCLRFERLRQEVQAKASGRHDAGYDVGALIQFWRHAQGKPVKMNHGMGPLPPSTDTGTFQPVKLRGRGR
jgi:hypothetical protein